MSKSGGADMMALQQRIRHRSATWPQRVASAAIAVLIGAGASFAPLYMDLWGGDMRHAMCPVLGGRPDVPDGRGYGLCVTPLPWFFGMGALCLLMAVCFASYCDCAGRFAERGGLPADGHVPESMRGAWRGMPAWLFSGFACCAALSVLAGAGWLPTLYFVAVMGVATQAMWDVLGRLGVSVPAAAVRVLSALAWGGAVAVVTQALVSYRVTFSGGVAGAVISACCAVMLCSVGNDDDDDLGLSGLLRTGPWFGSLALSLAWVLTLHRVVPLVAGPVRVNAPAFSVNDAGGLVESPWGEHAIPALVVVAVALTVVALVAGVAAAVVAGARSGRGAANRMRLARLGYAVAGVCMAVAFVIGFTLS